MKNIVFALFIVFFMIELNAKQIKPAFVFKSKGFVNDFVFDAGKIYVANDEGSVEIFDLSTRKRIDEIFIDPIFTTKQVWKNVKILSVDRYNGKTLMVSTSKGAYRNVWLHDGKKMKHIVKLDDKISIKEARFIEDGKFIFGTLSYEMILYNTSDNYNTYKSHIEQSSFSDLELSEDKKTMITASESGIITVMNVKTGKVMKQLPVLNLDNVYQIAYKNGNVLTGGQDRRVGVYPKNAKPYYIKSEFLVYSVALSPSGKLGMYSSDENSTLQLFDIPSGDKLATLEGHYAIPTTIKFFDEKGVFSAGYENKIFYWRLD